jgi:predicted Zn-dependent protease
MPGGKIAFYTGLLDKLEATDDEVAMVMGHEVAHALREHARAQAAKGQLTSIGATVLGMVVGKGQFSRVFDFANDLLNLKFSRGDETEADLVGLELAARAGYDPRAGVSLWQKMDKANKGLSIPWLSTHPSSESRIREIEAQSPRVLPLYEQAQKPEAASNTKSPQAKEAEAAPQQNLAPAKGQGTKKSTQKPAKKTTQGG